VRLIVVDDLFELVLAEGMAEGILWLNTAICPLGPAARETSRKSRNVRQGIVMTLTSFISARRDLRLRVFRLSIKEEAVTGEDSHVALGVVGILEHPEEQAVAFDALQLAFTIMQERRMSGG
jgi:hypothetical protein